MTEFSVLTEMLKRGATAPDLAEAKRVEFRSLTIGVWLTTIALLCAGAAIATVTERIAPLTDRCASKDAELLARISVLERSNAPTRQIADAIVNLVGARKACRSDEAGGLAFYDIALEATAAPPTMSQK